MPGLHQILNLPPPARAESTILSQSPRPEIGICPMRHRRDLWHVTSGARVGWSGADTDSPRRLRIPTPSGSSSTRTEAHGAFQGCLPSGGAMTGVQELDRPPNPSTREFSASRGTSGAIPARIRGAGSPRGPGSEGRSARRSPPMRLSQAGRSAYAGGGSLTRRSHSSAVTSTGRARQMVSNPGKFQRLGKSLHCRGLTG